MATDSGEFKLPIFPTPRLLIFGILFFPLICLTVTRPPRAGISISVLLYGGEESLFSKIASYESTGWGFPVLGTAVEVRISESTVRTYILQPAQVFGDEMQATVAHMQRHRCYPHCAINHI